MLEVLYFADCLILNSPVYAYVPTPNNLCSEKSITCNSDFGVSVGRGDFGFVTGQ